MTYERVEALVKSWVLGKFREDTSGHLATCPDAVVDSFEATDGSYGCATGCSYVHASATVSCRHGQSEEWDGGEFGELSWVIEELEAIDES